MFLFQSEGTLINKLQSKDKFAWWITTFDISKQNIAKTSKIGFSCKADLSVLEESIRKKFIDRMEEASGWEISKNIARFKWNY